jgi:DNA-binding NarL/FixJ family response regulator
MQIRATLLMVADHSLYCEGLQSLLARRAPHLHCIGVRTTGAALDRIRAIDSLDLVIADHSVAGALNGLSLLKQIGACRPTVTRVLMSESEDPGLSRQAQREGLAGYFSKRMESSEWVQALDVVLGGGSYFATQVPCATSLNDRQRSVLQLASAGLGNRQIAEKLHLAERTVKYHLSETFLRLSTSSRTEAVAKAAALGLISLHSNQTIAT